MLDAVLEPINQLNRSMGSNLGTNGEGDGDGNNTDDDDDRWGVGGGVGGDVDGGPGDVAGPVLMSML